MKGQIASYICWTVKYNASFSNGEIFGSSFCSERSADSILDTILSQILVRLLWSCCPTCEGPSGQVESGGKNGNLMVCHLEALQSTITCCRSLFTQAEELSWYLHFIVYASLSCLILDRADVWSAPISPIILSKGRRKSLLSLFALSWHSSSLATWPIIYPSQWQGLYLS